MGRARFYGAKFSKPLASGYRSRSEEGVANTLTELEVPFTYEKDRFKYVKEHSYTPDFCLPSADGKKLYLEVKGFFEPSDRTKMLAVIKQNPKLRVWMVFDNPNAWLTKSKKGTYATWCDQNGIPWVSRKELKGAMARIRGG